MKYAKIAIVFYSVFVMFFFTKHYAFATAPAGIEEDQSEQKLTSILDYQVKTRFISIFSEYCKWPPQSSAATPGKPFIIGAFEENDVSSYLIETVKTRTIAGKKAKILIIADEKEIEQCILLYITETSGKRLQKILEITDNLPILTVSDARGDAEKGYMIEMFMVEKKMHYIVNLIAVRKSGLLLDSTILKYADKIIQE
ncbi:MAG: YfiR family protein [Candidatus Aminicenantes bacterium]|nr:YfiR family protein [Candidatus Aminicenantes bacterium]